MFEIVRVPAKYIPAALIVCGAVNRPGLSPMLLASNIIRSFTEAGSATCPLCDGSPNQNEIIARIFSEETIKAWKEKMNIQVGIPKNSILVDCVIPTPAGPVHITGTNVNDVHGDGIAQ